MHTLIFENHRLIMFFKSKCDTENPMTCNDEWFDNIFKAGFKDGTMKINCTKGPKYR